MHVWQPNPGCVLVVRVAGRHRPGGANMDRDPCPEARARFRRARGSFLMMGAPGRLPTLEVEHIVVRFDGLLAIADLNFTVEEGEIVGLIGPNRAGKTTAFTVI